MIFSAGQGLYAILVTVLDDEYRARATYQAVLQRFGPVPPFVNIARSEQRHIAAVTSLFQRRGLPLPPDRWAGRAPVYHSLQQACAAGVEGELRNVQMYDGFLQQVSEPDVRQVFMQLRDASAYHHLPAFQACAGRLPAGYPMAAATASPASATSSPSGLGLWLGMLAGVGLVGWWHQRRTPV